MFLGIIVICQLKCIFYSLQAFINTSKEIYRKIQDGVFDVSNEVSVSVFKVVLHQFMPFVSSCLTFVF